ncbi:hypothetical protein EDB83DRAFT_2310642 [Lactarius deliciosus]|nr:hypothetical protein EDB83DRAFT_2310642 [Lactarius deliciosus]
MAPPGVPHTLLRWPAAACSCQGTCGQPWCTEPSPWESSEYGGHRPQVTVTVPTPTSVSEVIGVTQFGNQFVCTKTKSRCARMLDNEYTIKSMIDLYINTFRSYWVRVKELIELQFLV